MKRIICALTALVLVLGFMPAVMAEDIEPEVECEACFEVITRQDVIYSDEDEAMCIYCEEILSQKVLDALFNEDEEISDEYICSVCGEVLSEEEISMIGSELPICDVCNSEEEEYETDEPDEYIPGDDASSLIILNVSDWAKAEAEQAFAKNLIPMEMLGLDLKTDVTREQFAAIAVALYERITGRIADDSTEGLPFTDCNKNGSYTRYVAAAYKLGVTNGISETSFAPEQIITREQLATMLFRVIDKAGKDGVTPLEGLTAEVKFEDEQLISDYAKDSVYYMAQRGIIKGMSETQFVPSGVATKEQAILISNRIASTLY